VGPQAYPRPPGARRSSTVPYRHLGGTGRPSQIPDTPGQYDWTVTVSNVVASQVLRCYVQGVHPDYGYRQPQ
jgi:hypothetical protein